MTIPKSKPPCTCREHKFDAPLKINGHVFSLLNRPSEVSGLVEWNWECSCGSKGKSWTHQSDAVPYHRWETHAHKANPIRNIGERIEAIADARAVRDEAVVAATLKKLPAAYVKLVSEAIVLGAVRGYQRGLGRALGDNAGIMTDSVTIADVFIEGEHMPDLYPEIARRMNGARKTV